MPTFIPSFSKSLILALLSLIVCSIILFLVSEKDFLKHLISSIVVVLLFSSIITFLLNKNINYILIAFSIGLPTASMVDALRD